MENNTKKKKIGKIGKAISYFVLLFMFAVVVFYFWGSSSSLKSGDNASVIHFEFEGKELEKDSFRLMTYNMGYLSGMTNNKAVDRDVSLFEKNLSRLNALLEDLNIDVVCLQEIDFHSKRSFYVDQLTEMAEYGSYPNASRAINWDKKYIPFPYWPISNQFGEVLSGQAVLSYFPIIDNKRIPLAKANYAFYYNAFYLDRLAQLDVLSIGGRDVLVINVHLEAFDVKAREEQSDQLIKLYKEYEKKYPILLVGDFNSTPPNAKEPYATENTIAKILEIDGLKMATNLSSYLKNESEYFTFDSENPYIKIDYIFYDATKLSVKNVRVVKEAMDISDHLPLMADVFFVE
jgi:endonuclease/exonuclease/phosphatase family metal-dependent hydrolase